MRIAIGLLLCLLASPVWAGWTGGVEGGTVIRDDGSATKLRFKAENNSRPLSHYLFLDWLRTDDGENSYKAGYAPRYWFTEKIYAFGEASARVDKPLNIDNEQLFLGGVGVQLLASQTQSLWAEAGIGKRNTEFLNGFENDENLAIARAAFSQVLADLIRFELNVDAISGEELTETTAEAGLALRIAAGSVKVSYRTRRIDIDGGESLEDSDTFVSFNYGF